METSPLQSFALFDGVPSAALRGILPDHPERIIPGGEKLVTKGQRNAALYLLVDGEAEIYLDESARPLKVVHAGEIIGEVSLLDQEPATASAITRGECRVIVLGEETVWRLIRSCHPFAINFIQLMTRRFRGANTQVVSSIEKQRLFEERATIDNLTRLHNRGWLNDNFDRLLNRCKTDGLPFSYCMIDIDHFKKVNDTLGHQTGDLVLEKTAAVLKLLSRGGDHAVRYGGEEMAMLLPNTRVEHALIFAERLREHIEAQTIEHAPGMFVRVTVSIGVATLANDESGADLIRIADAALYEAKAQGRNQVRLATSKSA